MKQVRAWVMLDLEVVVEEKEVEEIVGEGLLLVEEGLLLAGGEGHKVKCRNNANVKCND